MNETIKSSIATLCKLAPSAYRMLLLIEKFDQLKAAGDLLPLAMSSDGE